MKEPGFFGDTLPEGVPAELTVSELEEMACRQQQQIETQRQLLAAKEQRLRFLKQHEAKHQLVASEHERLRRLRDKVETQELKLRKLRALRGQVDQTKLNNVSLTSDLESIRSLFNEKEKELSIAVAKVEELTRQLEELQRGRDANSSQVAPSAAAIELEKLRAELLYRNKLNEQHSARLTHQREMLAQRQEEMSAIDRRIAELQERLHRKRSLNQQLAHDINKQQSHDNNQKVQLQQMYPPPINQQNQSIQQQQQQQQQQKPNQQLTQMQQRLNQMMHVQKQQQQHQQQNLQQSMRSHMNASAKTTQLKNNLPQGVNVMQKPTTLGKPSTATNIAAVEPYNHVPSTRATHGQFLSSSQDIKQSSQRMSSISSNNHALNAQSRNNDQLAFHDPSASQRNHYPYPVQNQKDPRTHTNDDHRPHTYVKSPFADEEKKSSSEGGNTFLNKAENRLHEFWPNKFDTKYQMLPSPGTKYSNGTNGSITNNVNRYDYRRPAEGVETNSTTQYSHDVITNQKFNSNDKRLQEDNFNNNNSNNINNSDSINNNNNSNSYSNSNSNSSPASKDENHIEIATDNSSTTSADSLKNQNNKDQHQQQQSLIQMNIVRSMPIQSNSNKGLATPLSNSNYTSKSTNPNLPGRPYEVSPYSNYNQSESQSVTTSTTSVTFSGTYQKPVSSVSPIYQTSSTRIQLVQPQVIGSLATGQNQHNQNHDPRKSYQMSIDVPLNIPISNSTSNNLSISTISKPALPPKPAAPHKITPPPPPRQSAFHSQFANQNENKPATDAKLEIVSDHLDHEVESRLAGLELKDKNDKKYIARDTTDGEGGVRGKVNMNLRNGLAFNKDLPAKINAESPPPLPSVDPPSDEEIEKSMKTIYVQNINDNNNDSENKESNRMHYVTSINDRLMSDMSQDSSSSDTSSAENNYFVNSVRNIELPPAYLFPENESSSRDLISSTNSENDVDLILNLMNSEQINVDTLSENEKTSLASSSPDSENNDKINAYNEEIQLNDDMKKIRKGNLKNTGTANNKRRVSFDPLALLLDASLEGELELVIRTAGQVKNPSAANDEGITALHNAICAGHFEIVRFLVKFGCDVNAQDSDGWTPLHCAASCNNLSMVRFLVEHGACIFATTLSDQETAAEKCEEDEEGFDGCSEFLYSVQEKLGILNNGVVYSVFDYEAHNPDELSFEEGDRLTVLRKGDEWEREWWWSRHNDKEGYVPRNLLGLYPRVHRNTNRIQD